MSEMIRADNLTFRYTDFSHATHLALDGVNLTVPYGQFAAILGRNGSGKSTFAKHCNAIALPSGGRVLVDGIDTGNPDRVWDIRRACSMVFQNPDNQIVATVVEEDVAFGLENMGVAPREIRHRVDEALRMVDMQDYRLHAPHLLSGGQKQRVAIAGVLAMQPKCIVLDEPTAMLDPRGRADVLRVLHRLHAQKHLTIVLITHHMDEAVQAERVAVLDGGHLLLDGTPREIFVQTERLRALGLAAPQSVQLLEALNARAGAGLDIDALTVEECADRIEAWLKGESR
ncbi:MAG TPA: energy-coupling factor transporter ATPase [Candidatus Butyricicoccus stercorigallinarum]|nr:energy-coupling factor transporter ATPase [Candidatus Butyricicoccus stercorigallinarum]